MICTDCAGAADEAAAIAAGVKDQGMKRVRAHVLNGHERCKVRTAAGHCDCQHRTAPKRHLLEATR